MSSDTASIREAPYKNLIEALEWLVFGFVFVFPFWAAATLIVNIERAYNYIFLIREG